MIRDRSVRERREGREAGGREVYDGLRDLSEWGRGREEREREGRESNSSNVVGRKSMAGGAGGVI